MGLATLIPQPTLFGEVAMTRRAVACIAILLAVSASTAHADETRTGHYNGGTAYAFGLGAGFVLLPDGRDLDRDNETDIHPIGGVTPRANGTYRNAVITIDDRVFAGDAATNACMFNPDGDLICNADDHATGVGCGTRYLRNAPAPVDFVTVFAYSLAVTEDLEACGATAGTVQVRFY